MLLLALDTSTRYSSVALCSEEGVLSEYTWFSGNNHSTELLGHVQRITAEHHVALQQLDVVAVATGPGSFNGVRVAVGAAKALAFSLQKPLIAVSTLDIVAAQQYHWRGPLCALLEAGRSELYAACYVYDEQRSDTGVLTSHLRRLSDYLLFSPQQLVDHLQAHIQNWFTISGDAGATHLPPYLFCGEISAISRQALHALLQEQSIFANNLQSTRRAAMLAMLAFQRLQEGHLDDPLALEPLYLRRPSITKSTRKKPLLGGTSQRPTGQDTTEREEGALRH